MKNTRRNLQSVILIAGLLFIFNPAVLIGQQNFQNSSQPPKPALYLGLGLSVNEYGFGFGLELPIADKISVNGNIGIGGWGWKAGGSLNFYTSQVSEKSEFSLGYSYASGLKDFSYELWVDPNETKKMVTLDLNPVSTINIIYTYNLRMGSSGKLGFSAGYAIPVTNTPYNVKSSGATLSSTSKQVMDMMTPGGLIIGIKFMFGL